MPHPMPRLCDRFGWKDLNSHSFAPCRRVVDMAGGPPRRCSKSSNLMYLRGKAIQVSRREGKAFNQVLGTQPGGYRRNVVEVQQRRRSFWCHLPCEFFRGRRSDFATYSSPMISMSVKQTKTPGGKSPSRKLLNWRELSGHILLRVGKSVEAHALLGGLASARTDSHFRRSPRRPLLRASELLSRSSNDKAASRKFNPPGPYATIQ
jgi:hypothetical protein